MGPKGREQASRQIKDYGTAFPAEGTESASILRELDETVEEEASVTDTERLTAQERVVLVKGVSGGHSRELPGSCQRV